MKKWLLLWLLTLPLTAAAELYVTIIQGLGGTDLYTDRFSEQTGKYTQALGALTAKNRLKTLIGEQATRQNILTHFQTLKKTLTAKDRIGMILVGHGSYDGHEFKFNIPGPDLTGADIGAIMNAWPAQLQLLLVTSSASGAILKELKQDNRIIITATRSGTERNAPLFGVYFAAALADPAADTDKNDTISAAEAYAYAERMTKDFYEGEGRLATEHPQLEGNKADQFQLARLTPARPTSATSPELARLDQRRQDLDQAIADLRLRKDEFRDNDEYLIALQDLLLQLSEVEEQIEA
ncbi:MAG: hypothetical protein HW386_1475, partial [Gammaproteobacteria bacterium]|nr:hypothetical protein [Gammaproteobacteria bacterium]